MKLVWAGHHWPRLTVGSCAGEIHELKEELASLDRPKKKEAVKKVIAAMTVGKDVSMLFPHVVNCMQTEDLELKKLVYLYLINYAKTQPDLAIMAVNTFVKAGSKQLRQHRRQAQSQQLTATACPSAGLSRAQSTHQGIGSQDYGLYPGGQDYRVSVRPTAAVPEGKFSSLSSYVLAGHQPCSASPVPGRCNHRLDPVSSVALQQLPSGQSAVLSNR